MRFAAERVRSSVLFCHDIRAPGDNPPATALFRMSLNGCTCGTQAPRSIPRPVRHEMHVARAARRTDEAAGPRQADKRNLCGERWAKWVAFQAAIRLGQTPSIEGNRRPRKSQAKYSPEDWCRSVPSPRDRRYCSRNLCQIRQYRFDYSRFPFGCCNYSLLA